jgi:LPS-assembly protein
MSVFFRKFLPFCLLTTIAFFIPTACFGQEPASLPIQVKGDTVEYFQEGQKAVGKGHVTVDYEGARLEADTITVYMDTKMATAEGHVTLTQKGSTFKGKRAEYDFAKKVGHVDKMDASIQNTYFGKAQKIVRVEENHYRIVDSYVSTCCGDDPFYKLSAHNIDYYPDDKVVMRNAVLFVRNIPILFIPYYEQPFVDFDRFPVHLVPGRRSEWGAFLLSKWRYNLVNRPEMTVKGNVLLDYRDKRGFGGGVENFYHGDKIGHGVVRAYYTNDNNPPEDINSNRHRTQWRHQSKLGPSTTLTTEWNKLSDKDVVKDFFYHEEYEKDVAPDNYISIITAKPEYTFSILDRERLDDFYTSVERSPELRFDTHNRPFADTPFYLREEIQFSNLKRTAAESDTSLDVVRLDTNHTVHYAARIGDVSVTPRVGTRHTFYSRDMDGDRDLVRGTFEPGIDVSTHFYKTYNIYIKTLGLDVNQARHIFTPTVSYHYRPNPTTSRTLLQQFDALDAIDKENFIRLNFENKLFVKNHGESGELYSREFARVLPFLDVDLHTGRLENVGLDAEFRPYTWMGIEADISYDANRRDFDAANFDLYFTRGRWTAAVGQRYVQDQSSQTTAEIRLKLNDEWEFKVYDRYEFEEGASKEFEFTVSKTFDCVIADFTYNRREGDTFYFALRLKAFPSTPFSLSQSYNHPKASSAQP